MLVRIGRVVSVLIVLAIAPVAFLSPGPAATAVTPPAIALLTAVNAAGHGRLRSGDLHLRQGHTGDPQRGLRDWACHFQPERDPVVPPIASAARLVITMSNAADEDLTTSPLVVTYPGPLRFSANLPNVTDLVQLQDFEATLTWAIGVNDSGVTAVARIQGGPTRVEVDIPHSTRAVLVNASFTG